MALGIGANKVAAQHLAVDRLPLLGGSGLSNAKGGQIIVAALLDLVGRATGQDIHKVPCAEVFAGAQDGGQGHLHGFGPVEGFGRFFALIAVATRFAVFAEVGEELGATAAQCLGQSQKRVQSAMIGGFAFGRCRAFVDLATAQADVVGAVKGEGFGRGTVPAAAPDFLVIALDRLGQIGVGDPADIRLVDPHAEGDGSADDQPIFNRETVFDGAALVGLHPAVVGGGHVTLLVQRIGKTFGLGAGATVDDAGLPLSRGGEVQDLLARLVLWREGQMDVRTVEAVQE